MASRINNHGWLAVCDIQGVPSHQLSCGQLASGIWSFKYCFLVQQKLLLLDGEAAESFFSEDPDNSTKIEDDVFRYMVFQDSECTETPTDSRRRRQASDNGNATSPTKEALPTFLQKKIPPAIRRTKSSKAGQGKENRPLLDMTSLMAQSSNLRNTEVELPFFMPAIESPDVIDLTNCATEFEDAIVRPLHHSILGRNHCFEVVTNDGTRCFGCDSGGEREAWIEKIKRAINPNLDNSRRIEHQLTLFVQEAKGLPTKKKYFCEVCLDRKLCARTTSKWKNDSSIFWGEHFEFTSMPDVEDVTVHLYKDSDKKKKKDKDYIGLVNLPVRSLVNQQSVEKWYTLSTPSGNNKSKAGESMALRIKAKFLSTKVLPTEQYKAFAERVSANYLSICRCLNNVISVSRKDEISRILVNIMHGTGCIKDFMTDVVMDEVEKVDEESLIFRENTIGTKSVEAMLRLVGMKYLNDTLGDFILALFNMEEECEVDGSRLPPHASLEANQKNLQMSCEIAFCKIASSTSNFPSELREVMASWRVKCEESGRTRIANRLVTASLFLRLLCPAILNPSLFELANEVPDTKVSRTLTLVAKVIQNLANRSRFGNKEEYMQFMDVFIREKWDDMGAFIANVSDPTIPPLNKGFQGFIDLGKEFAKLHAFFVELLPTLDQATVDGLGDLPCILDKITEALEKPAPTYPSPPLRRISTEPPNLSQIVEGVALSHDTESLPGPGSSSTPVVGRRGLFPAGGASSLRDLREILNVHDDSHYDVPHNAVNGIAVSPSHHGSHPSLPITCSYNNSNNASANWNRQTLSSTENIMTSTNASSKQSHFSDRPPLMFCNPAYQMPQQLSRGVSTPAALSNIHDALHLKLPQHRNSAKDQSGDFLKKAPDSKLHVPLSFSNPLQALDGARSHHLETVFTTETVTYSAPARYLIGSGSAENNQTSEIFSAARGSSSRVSANIYNMNSMSSEGTTRSNDSSLSSRQSSTSTATHSNRSNSSGEMADVMQRANKSDMKQGQEETGITVTPNSTASKTKDTRSDDDCMVDDDQLLMSVETISPSVSNAQLKTGLQSHHQHQRSKAKQQDDQLYKPQPKPRSSIGHVVREQSAVSRKTSVPNISSRNVSQLTPRRSSAGNVRPLQPSDEPAKYPSFHLSKLDQDAILELNELTDLESPGQDQRHRQKPDGSRPSSKNHDGFVTAPVAAVKSRVVVSTSNANRVKTSKHGSASSYQQKTHDNPPSAQPGRRGSYQKPSSSTQKPASQTPSGHPAALPPTTPEGQLSPEARTAQWILNNVPTPNKEMKREEEMEVVLSPKDYEDRIIRLETEVERLKSHINETHRNAEQREALLLEKARNAEKREARACDKLRRQSEESEKMRRVADEKLQKVLQRLNSLEADHHREISDRNRERGELQAVIASKDFMVTEQQKRIVRLEGKLEVGASGSRKQGDIGGGSMSYIDDEAGMASARDRKAPVKKEFAATTSAAADSFCNGQFYMQGLSSGSASSSSSI